MHPFFLQEPRVNAIIMIAKIKYVFFIIFIFIKDITNFLKNKAKKKRLQTVFYFYLNHSWMTSSIGVPFTNRALIFASNSSANSGLSNKIDLIESRPCPKRVSP